MICSGAESTLKWLKVVKAERHDAVEVVRYGRKLDKTNTGVICRRCGENHMQDLRLQGSGSKNVWNWWKGKKKFV
jgi:hypothetical protein